ncbi:MAG: hypothetical protein ACTTJH_06045 [Bacteroidales bacterium]
MAGIEEKILDIEKKVKFLVWDRIELKKNLSDKEQELAILKEQIRELVDENRELKKNKTINNLEKIIINNSDIAECRILINNLLRRINRSISIISKDNNGREFDD